MLKSMAPNTGRMAVVLPHGALFRMGVEGKIRQKIAEMDVLEAVIGLGPNLFYGTGLAACILVFCARKKADRKKRVLTIDASRLFKKGRNQNTLEPEHGGGNISTDTRHIVDDDEHPQDQLVIKVQLGKGQGLSHKANQRWVWIALLYRWMKLPGSFLLMRLET